MKLAITGSFGTGKTTHLFELAKDCKMKYPDLSIGLIQEMARFCPYPVNEEASFDAQMWIYCTQMKLEIEYKKLYDITICDRTLFDSVAYMMVNGYKEEAVSMYQLALHQANTYDRIIFRTISKSDYFTKDGFRSDNPQFRENVETELIRIYDDINNRYPWFEKKEHEYGFELTRELKTRIPRISGNTITLGKKVADVIKNKPNQRCGFGSEFDGIEELRKNSTDFQETDFVDDDLPNVPVPPPPARDGEINNG